MKNAKQKKHVKALIKKNISKRRKTHVKGLKEMDILEANINFVQDIFHKLSNYKPAFNYPDVPIEVINLTGDDDEVEFIGVKKAGEYTNSDDNCTVCLFKRKEKKKYKCGHEICLNCAKRWEKLNKTCPFCRGSIC
jgi:hypothetical protein